MKLLNSVKLTFLAALTMAIVLGLSLQTLAQSETAAVLGSVRDSNAAVLQGAKVTLLNIATGIESTATTDENGDFQFVNVRIGNYRITVEAQGFSRTTTEVNCGSDRDGDSNGRG
jgi:hypothetical protein